MGFKLRRRSVYIGTIVALLAMVAGLAVAAVSGIVFTTGTGNQNFGSITTGNTIYSSASTVTLSLVSGDGLTNGCLLTTTYAGSAANIPVVGTGTTCLASNEWYDQLTFTGVNVPASASDTFWIGVNGAAAGAGFTVIGSGTAIVGGTLNIYIDDGPTSGAPAITSVDVTVTGS
ncbi:MAG: hypothetical protein WCB18_08040 [Thermoplasmata archaeon]